MASLQKLLKIGTIYVVPDLFVDPSRIYNPVDCDGYSIFV